MGNELLCKAWLGEPLHWTGYNAFGSGKMASPSPSPLHVWMTRTQWMEKRGELIEKIYIYIYPVCMNSKAATSTVSMCPRKNVYTVIYIYTVYIYTYIYTIYIYIYDCIYIK